MSLLLKNSCGWWRNLEIDFEVGGSRPEVRGAAVTARRVVVSKEALKRAGARSTKASAKLEGREMPEGYVRPASVQRWIDQQSADVRAAGYASELVDRDGSAGQTDEL